MIRTKRGLIVSGGVTFLLGLIIMFPARVAVDLSTPPGVAISGVQGTIWHGSASEAAVAGIYLRDVQWRLNKLRLFAGKLSYSVKATPVSGFFESDISIRTNGRLSLTSLTAALPLDLFAAASGIRGLQGSASIQFERIEIVDGFAVAADGTIQVANLIVPIVGSDSLGGYKADFFTQNNGISASIEDTDGVVDLAGSIQIRTDRSFEFIGQVVMTSATPESVRRQLRFLPPANERGQQELRLEGIL